MASVMDRSRLEKSLPPNSRCEGQAFQELESCSFYDCLYKSECLVEETNETVAVKLKELEREIDKLPESSKDAYCVALGQEIKQNTNYVRSKKLLLAFLRADKFDVPKAAIRMASFFKHKLDLFGPTKLPQRITQDDLNDDDKKVLASGFFHYGGCDCGGRVVCLIQWDRLRSLSLLNPHYAKSICRVTFYYVFAIEDSEDSQRKGVIGVRWNVNSNLALKDYQVIFASHVTMVLRAMPASVAAFHNCCGNATSYMSVSLMDSFAKKFCNHLCSKIHGPTAAACISGLSKYGIDVDALLLFQSGDFDIESYHKKLKVMQESEQSIKRRKIEQINRLHERQYEFPSNNRSENYEQNLSSLTDSYRNSPSVQSESRILLTKQTNIHTDPTSQNLGDGHLPSKLMSILEDNAAPDAIWWLPCGTSFAIEKDRFPDIVLFKEFNAIRMDSFLRRMRRWGFQRMAKRKKDGNCIIFKHPLFQKNSVHLLKEWGKEAVMEKFPVRLMKALDNKSASNVIRWVNNGKAFAIDRAKLKSELLEKHFEGLKLKSFQRNMLRWEFKQLQTTNSNPRILVFHHPSFQKNSPELLDYWSSPKNKLSSD